MKAFAFVLLCALAAVQGRYTGLQSTRSAAVLGENPWLVHLRIAVSTSGLLNTGAGTLISNSWVLTTADNVATARFIWVRYGAVNTVNPSLVTENSVVRINPNYNAATGENNLGLISINRFVESTDFIAPISLTGSVSDSARFCNYGGEDIPGEQLNCYEVAVAEEEGALEVSSDEVAATAFDNGAPLVYDFSQIAILVGPGSEGSVGKFLPIADYREWIGQETGLEVTSQVPEAVRFIH